MASYKNKIRVIGKQLKISVFSTFEREDIKVTRCYLVGSEIYFIIEDREDNTINCIHYRIKEKDLIDAIDKGYVMVGYKEKDDNKRYICQLESFHNDSVCILKLNKCLVGCRIRTMLKYGYNFEPHSVREEILSSPDTLKIETIGVL